MFSCLQVPRIAGKHCQSASLEKSGHFFFGAKMNQQTTLTTGSNGESALRDLFALTDEQILEIEPDAQDVKLSSGPPPAGEEPPRVAPASLPAGSSANAQQQESRLEAGATEPPAWLAAQMKDPWSGEEARELWNGVQQARAEAAAYREVFAKPEDARALKEIYPGGVNEARAAAERVRQLDNIDRAYFTGDTAQRSQLAAMMLREDPAAFREMVFEGLRALEKANVAPPGPGHVSTPNSSGSTTQRSSHNSSAAGRNDSGPSLGMTEQKDTPVSKGSAQEAQVAAYASFEKATNEELERRVGGAIERTLAQALPAAARTDGAALGGRLSSAIRQDIEKALRGDRQLGEQVAQILSGRRLDDEARGQVVRLIGERAQQLLPGAAKRVINEWTQATFAAHRARPNQSQSVADRTDLTPARSAATIPPLRSGNASRTSGRNDNGGARGNGIDYRKLSDEQILEI
jgi:hypothetical protein